MVSLLITLVSPQPDVIDAQWHIKGTEMVSLLITLVSPQPDVIDAQWDIKGGVDGEFINNPSQPTA